MSHRSGGGGYTRGGGGFRHRGRLSGSPYWRDKQRPQQKQQQDDQDPNRSIEQLGSTPSRESGDHTMPEQSPIEPVPTKEVKKFSNKARVFIANLPRDMTEPELRELFEPYGEVQEVFLQKEKSFGFCRMAYKSEAERAIAALNGILVKGRDLKVRFAASSSLVKVDNIHPLVSNELLIEAFSQFGEVEEAVIVTDDRGKSKGYGIVEFARKQGAMNAMTRCKNAPFLLTKSPIPVVVTEYERDNEDNGLPEKSITKNQSYHNEYEARPRFAAPGDVEFLIASRWKVIFEEEKSQRAELEARIKEKRNMVRDEMANIHEQHKTELLRQELAHHQAEQLRLLQQLSERERGLGSHGGLMPPVAPPLFPTDELALDPGQIPIPGLGGAVNTLPPNGPPLFPQPLMGQPNYENYH